MRRTCRHYRALLPGYIERELSPAQRARVSRHLNECAECYVAYIEQRQLVQELSISVPRIGAAQLGMQPHLDKIRAAVMAEMAAPAARKPKLRIDQARYSLAALLLMMALLLPWSMRNRSFALPPPPQPETLTPQGTAVAAVPTATATQRQPTATLQSNYAPVFGATETP